MTEIIENMDKVSKKILEDAQNEAAGIIESAKKTAAEIIGDAKNKREKKLNNAKLEAESIYKKVYELEISKAKAEMEQEILMQKIGIINSLLEKSASKLVSGNSSRYESFLKDTLQKLVLSEVQYQIGKKEQFITDSILEKISGSLKLKKSGQESDFDHGIKIIEGKKEYSISAETLIRTKIDDIRIELAQFLFKKE